jgi:phosphoribosyl-dephospho-CoA transferase
MKSQSQLIFNKSDSIHSRTKERKNLSHMLKLKNSELLSIEISTQGSVGTNNGVYSPCSYSLDFAFLQAMHCSQIHCTSLFIFGQ